MADHTATIPPSQIKRGRKFDQVLRGAREIFLSDGFEGASVDDIARAAGVSKATLYSYFPDKRMLFMEVASAECRTQADRAVDTIDMTQPIDRVLTDIATSMVEFFASRFGQRMFRMCVAESDRFPDLGQQFYRCGPGLIQDRLIMFFRKGVDRGDLQIDDFALAADQFHELCKADIFPRLMFNMATTFSAAEKSRVVRGAVDMFLARYGIKAL